MKELTIYQSLRETWGGRWRSTGGVTLHEHGFSEDPRLRVNGCTVLLNTRSPSTFSQRRIWQRMLGREAASENGLTDIPEWKRGVSMVYL